MLPLTAEGLPVLLLVYLSVCSNTDAGALLLAGAVQWIKRLSSITTAFKSTGSRLPVLVKQTVYHAKS